MRFPLSKLADKTIRLPRLGEFPIVLHPGFALAVLLVTGPFWFSLSFAGAALALTALAVIVLSISIHELAHLAVARRCGASLARIDSHALGSTSQLASAPERLSRHLAIAFAGPAANLMLALFSSLMLVQLLEPHLVKAGCETIEDGYEALSFPAKGVACAMFANLVLAIVNLLPVRPLDGGWLAYRDLRQRGGVLHANLIAGTHAVVLGVSSLLLIVAMLIVVVPV
jgi:Zn-dependent protease